MRTTTPSPWTERVGLAVAAAFVSLCPLFLDRAAVDAIEFPRMSLLLGAVLLLTLLGFTSWLWSSYPMPWRALDWRTPSGLLNLGVLLWFLSATVSTFSSVSPSTSFWGVQGSYGGLLTMAGYVGLFAALRWLLRSQDDARGMVLAVLPAVAGVAGYAVLQVCGRDPLVWNDLSGYSYLTRWFSTLGHPNHLAAFAVMTLPLVCYGCWLSYRRRRWVGVAALTGLALALLLAVACSLSRGSWLALAVVMLLLTPVAWKRFGPWRVVAAVMVLVLGLGVAWLAAGQWPQTVAYRKALGARVNEMGDAGGRRHIWQASWEMFLERPAVGVGPDAYGLEFGQHRPVGLNRLEWDTLLLNAHNLPLHTAATQGLLGLLALGVMTAGLGRCAWFALRRPQHRSLAWIATVGVVAFVVQIQFNYSVVACGTLVVLFAAVLARLTESEDAPASDPGRTHWLRGGMIVGSCLGALTLAHAFLCDAVAVDRFRALATWTVSGAVLVVLAVSGVLMHGRCLALPRQPSPQWTGVGSWRVVTQVGMVIVAAWLARVVVLAPYEASHLSREAEAMMPSDPHRADRLFARAIELTPGQTVHIRRLARAAVRLGLCCTEEEHRRLAFCRAHDVLARAVEMVPEDAFARSELAQTQVLTSAWYPARADEAVNQLDAALAREPRCSAVLLNACRACLSLKRHDRARDLATRLTSLYPDFGPGVAVLALLDWNAGDRASALQRARHAEWLAWRGEWGARCDFNDLTAWMFVHAGEMEEARKRAEEGARRRPERPLPHLVLARLAELEGDRREAVSGYRRVLDLCPGHAEAGQALGRLQRLPLVHK